MKIKTMIATMLAAAVVFSMAGCGSSANTAQTDAEETADETEDGSEEDAAEGDTEYDEDVYEDDDVMVEEFDTSENIINEYAGAYTDEANGLYSAYFEAIDNTNGVSVSVGMNGDDGSYTYWQMYGTFDGTKVTYTEGFKNVEAPNEDNPEESVDETIYDDGTGYFEFTSDKKVIWKDDKEDAGNGIVFVWDEELNQQIQDFMDSMFSDTQNPIMNWIGPYIDSSHKDFSMFIDTGAEDTNGCTVTVTQLTDVNQTTTWTMEGVFNEETLAIDYTGCVKSKNKLGNQSEVISSETVYEDGTGRFVINDTDQSITWEDDKEDAGKDLIFTFDMDYEGDEGFFEEEDLDVEDFVENAEVETQE